MALLNLHVLTRDISTGWMAVAVLWKGKGTALFCWGQFCQILTLVLVSR